MIVINKKKLYASLLIFLLSLIVIFRLLGDGPDFSNYRDIFFWIQTAEPFWFVISVINHLFGNYFITLFLITCFSLFCKFNYYRYVDNKVFYFVLLFCYTVTFFLLHEYTQIRIALAIGLFMLYMSKIEKVSVIKYFLFIGILMCVHYSAVVFFPFYFFSKIRSYKKYITLPLLLFVFDILFLNLFREHDVFNKFLNVVFMERFGFLGEMLKTKGGIHQEQLSVFNKLYLLFLFILIQTYYFCFYRNRITDSRQIISYKCLSYSLCLFYVCIYTPYSIMTLRFSEIFLPFALPMLFYNLKLIKEKFIYSIFIFIVIVMLSLKLSTVIGVL